MIIHRLIAENVLKYANLELDDLPEQGLIAVSGQNESGKSTIGETLCFALFGRTFSLEPGDIGKIIHWGADRCSVRLGFSVDDGKRYEIARFLDIDGNHGARLNLEGAEDQPLARGVDAVADALFELIGYEYDEFIESFYLAQREITTPHPHSHAVKAMAGIAPLEFAANGFAREMEKDRRELVRARDEATDLNNQLVALAMQEGHLAELERSHHALEVMGEDLEQRAGNLESAALVYQDNAPRRHATRSSRSRARGLAVITLLLSLIGIGGWAELTQRPDSSIATTLQSYVTGVMPSWSAANIPWLMYLGVGFAVLFLFFVIRSGVLSQRLSRLQEASAVLGEQLDELFKLESLQAGHHAAAEQLAADQQGDELQINQPLMEPTEEERQQLLNDVMASTASAEAVRDGVSQELALVRRVIQHTGEQAARLDSVIQQEKIRVNNHNKINVLIDNFKDIIETKSKRIEMRELAIELLDGAIRHVSQQFNHELRGLVGRMLPLFTEDRYEHLQIDEDLSVRVFSKDKRDFMDLEEISSGTQRQIMLALRLALSQELIGRVVQGKQFVFLDEPFAFFDETRTRSALKVFSELSDQIAQTWIVSQEFPKNIVFDRAIKCARTNEQLSDEAAA